MITCCDCACRVVFISTNSEVTETTAQVIKVVAVKIRTIQYINLHFFLLAFAMYGNPWNVMIEKSNLAAMYIVFNGSVLVRHNFMPRLLSVKINIVVVCISGCCLVVNCISIVFICVC